jgi:SAM-dependent methyltransferase
MSVSDHLRIDLAEYDWRIQTFVPHYQDLVRIAAESLRFVTTAEPRIVDLGVGTGALAAACLAARPEAELVGIDNDPGMLRAAQTRLAAQPRVRLVEADFLRLDLPSCDAIVACISLHHVRRAEAKRDFYARCREALRPSGVLVSADCFPGAEPAVAREHREAWLAHLMRSYSRAEAEAHLASWADEDVYFPLESELGWLREAGFRPEVLWRIEGFAVVAAFAPADETRHDRPMRADRH